jgi:hypothetical protein
VLDEAGEEEGETDGIYACVVINNSGAGDKDARKREERMLASDPSNQETGKWHRMSIQSMAYKPSMPPPIELYKLYKKLVDGVEKRCNMLTIAMLPEHTQAMATRIKGIRSKLPLVKSEMKPLGTSTEEKDKVVLEKVIFQCHNWFIAIAEANDKHDRAYVLQYALDGIFATLHAGGNSLASRYGDRWHDYSLLEKRQAANVPSTDQIEAQTIAAVKDAKAKSDLLSKRVAGQPAAGPSPDSTGSGTGQTGRTLQSGGGTKSPFQPPYPAPDGQQWVWNNSSQELELQPLQQFGGSQQGRFYPGTYNRGARSKGKYKNFGGAATRGGLFGAARGAGGFRRFNGGFGNRGGRGNFQAQPFQQLPFQQQQQFQQPLPQSLLQIPQNYGNQ